jgi:ASC-1-like (ASCH) protein
MNLSVKSLILTGLLLQVLIQSGIAQTVLPASQSISARLLQDKIAGGWAGKIIGVTYGGPTEFKAQEKTYDEPITWVPADVIGSLEQDDLYVQLTFLMTMDQYGIEAPSKKFQELFAKAGYELWHANVQARKNYFDSIFPPMSGHPKNNIHADDIDFQIEADYIGFMCPGMPQTSNRIADKIGHVMNYGDGVYGGVFLSALYSQAYFESNIRTLVEKALQALPAKSEYAKIIHDVLILHDHYPKDWRAAWTELEAKWGTEHICDAGTTSNIDAKFNGAFIVMGLLFGEGEPLKTMEIATRCGQDSDCNPSNVMAVLGVIKGFSGLPIDYQEAMRKMGDSLFIHTNYSFNKAVDQTLKYAKELIVKNGGTITSKEIKIKTQVLKPSAYEASFPKLIYDKTVEVNDQNGWTFKGNWMAFNKDNPKAKFSNHAGDEARFDFAGTGVSLNGNWFKDCGQADIYIDGAFDRTIDTYFFFANQTHNNMDLYHITNLKPGKHTLKVVVKGTKRAEDTGENIYLTKAIVFKTGSKRSESFKFSFQK